MHDTCCDTDRSRRLATFIAHHDRSTFEIAKAFIEHVAPVFPGVKRMLPMGTKTARYQTACAIAAVCKHAGDLAEIGPMIAATGADLAKRGFTAAHVPAARAAFLSAVRRCAGGDWTAEIEKDWNEVISEFVGHLALPTARTENVRMAA